MTYLTLTMTIWAHIKLSFRGVLMDKGLYIIQAAYCVILNEIDDLIGLINLRLFLKRFDYAV